ncbi:hypothetical protein SVIOM74S_03488 [Streptomyces violarus]
MELLRADVAAVLGYPHAEALPAGKSLADLVAWPCRSATG